MKPKKPNPGKSLAEINPELAKQWHPTKNGFLKRSVGAVIVVPPRGLVGYKPLNTSKILDNG